MSIILLFDFGFRSAWYCDVRQEISPLRARFSAGSNVNHMSLAALKKKILDLFLM